MGHLTLPVLGAMAGMALVDSTSVSTLAVPVWMMARRPRRDRAVVAYLIGAALGYAALGVGLQLLLHLGFRAWLAPVKHLREVRPLAWVQLGVGVLMLLAALAALTPLGRRRLARRRGSAQSGPSARQVAVLERLLGAKAAVPTTFAVGILVAVVEGWTIMAYLATITLLSTHNVTLPLAGAVMLGYGIIMIIPALLLVAARSRYAEAADRFQDQAQAWLGRHGSTLLAVALAAIGVVIALNALHRLHLPLY